MITANDILHLDYTPDLTAAGIAFACHSLPHTYDRAGASSYDRLRRIVAGVSVELAFRRYLAQEDIPFDVKAAAAFTDPDHYDIALGGHRCRIQSFLISHRNQIAALSSNLQLALKAPALVPLDHYSADGQSAEDIYLFALITGLTSASSEDVQKAYDAGLPVHLIHTMPSTWRRPKVWIPLGPLVLKSEADQALVIEIGGQDVARGFLARTAELPPQTRLSVEDGFYSLTYLHVKSEPRGRLGIHSPTRAETLTIQKRDWNNIWVYGTDIYLAGWITRDEFRQRASLIPEGTRVFQFSRTRTKNLAVPIAQLKPLSALFERTRAWAACRR
jgi:hypothetical protein